MSESQGKNKTKKSPSFGKIMLASGVGTLIVLIIVGIFKILLLFGIIGTLENSKTVAVADNSFLKIDLTKAMEERSPSDLASISSSVSDVGLSDMLRCINAAATDAKIGGIYLYMGSSFPHSWGKSEELRQALADFCESGKPILAYANNYSQQGYFVASVADSIYLNPSGITEFRGIGAVSLFFKELLDKLSIKVTLVRPRNNSLKSAGEMYTMDRMSEANRRQIREYINSIWEYVVAQIADARDISTERLNELADGLEACLAEDALSNGLVDRLCFENDIRQTMKESYGCEKSIDIADYAKTLKTNIMAKQQIAVIYAEGDVVPGSGYNTAVYSDKITKALDDAAKDERVKAIVLRVNSPGGQVTASEIMTNAVMRAKQKKPVVVSMGDVAASAGYEISCNATYIVAEPTTITGSIGVFATIPELGASVKRYLGVTTDTVSTNTNSTLSALRPLSPTAMKLLQRNVEDFYAVFVDRVAKGRGLRNEFVDSIARGRVWTGRDALKLGLVDALGGLDDAISIAADSAGVSNYEVVDYPVAENILDEILNRKKNSSGTIKTKAPAPVASEWPMAPVFGDGVWIAGQAMMETLNRICETRGLQARVEFFIIEN